MTQLRRRVDGSDPLAHSPLVERLSQALAARGAALVAWHDPHAEVELAPTPIRMSAPAAAGLLPERAQPGDSARCAFTTGAGTLIGIDRRVISPSGRCVAH